MQRKTFLINEHGSVLLLSGIILLLLVVAAALAVDLGQLYIAKQRAQNVCDAAVLAGAPFLTGSPSCTVESAQPTVKAMECAITNNRALQPVWKVLIPGTSESGVKVEFPYGRIEDPYTHRVLTPNLGDAIRVTGEIKVNFALISVIGILSQRVRATSIVVRSGSNTLTTDLFVPLSVASSSIYGNPPAVYGDSLPIKVGSWKSGWIGPGNFGAVILPGDGPGASDFNNRLAGYGGPVTLSLDPPNNILDTKTGNMVGPTTAGLEERLCRETDPRFISPEKDDTAWQDWLHSYDAASGSFASTWRILIVPVIDDDPEDNGKSSVQITGFAALFLESLPDSKKDAIYARLIQGVQVGDRIYFLPPDGSSAARASTFASVKLTF